MVGCPSTRHGELEESPVEALISGRIARGLRSAEPRSRSANARPFGRARPRSRARAHPQLTRVRSPRRPAARADRQRARVLHRTAHAARTCLMTCSSAPAVAAVAATLPVRPAARDGSLLASRLRPPRDRRRHDDTARARRPGARPSSTSASILARTMSIVAPPPPSVPAPRGMLTRMRCSAHRQPNFAVTFLLFRALVVRVREDLLPLRETRRACRRPAAPPRPSPREDASVAHRARLLHVCVTMTIAFSAAELEHSVLDPPRWRSGRAEPARP
jgi:hypothetical protein